MSVWTERFEEMQNQLIRDYTNELDKIIVDYFGYVFPNVTIIPFNMDFPENINKFVDNDGSERNFWLKEGF